MVNNETDEARRTLSELNKARIALRRINYLSKTISGDDIYLQEIFKISNEILEREKKHDKRSEWTW